MVKLRCVLSHILWPLQACRSLGCLVPPDFGRSVNPISEQAWSHGGLRTRALGQALSQSEGSDYAHHITTCYQNFQTFLRHCHCMDQILAWHSFDKTEEFICQQKKGNFWHWHWIVMYLLFYKKYYALLPLFIELEVSYKTRYFQFNNFSHYKLLFSRPTIHF